MPPANTSSMESETPPPERLRHVRTTCGMNDTVVSVPAAKPSTEIEFILQYYVGPHDRGAAKIPPAGALLAVRRADRAAHGRGARPARSRSLRSAVWRQTAAF